MEKSEEQKIVEKRLQEFIEYFVDEFDTRIEFYRKVLEEKSDAATGGIKSAVLTGSKQGISGGVSFATGIPFLGPLVGAIYEQGGKKIVTSLEEKSNKKEANSLYDLIFNYKGKENQEKYKRILIEASYEIFYSFEQQFMNITVEKGGETRAMLKLAKTTVTKIIEYFINNEEKFTLEGIIKSVIAIQEGRLNKFVSIFKSGRTVLKKNDDKSKWSTLNLLTKCGLQIEEDSNILFYTSKYLEPKEYGFRRICSCEDKDVIINNYTSSDLNNINYKFLLSLQDKKIYVDKIYTILSQRDPKKMEERFKETCENIQKEILDTLETIKKEQEESLDFTDITNLIKKIEKDILNEICLYYIKNKNLFDEAKNDRQVKHDATMNKVNANNSSLQDIDANVKQTLVKVDYIHEHVKTQAKKPLFFQLPQFIYTYIGRQNQLNEIKEAQLERKIIFINGDKGVGKSELAKKYSFDVKQEGNSNIIWLYCDNNESMVYGLRDLALLLGFDLTEKTNLEIIEEVFSHFETKKTLFIFDNCRRNSVLVNNITNYINITNNITIIITSNSDTCCETYHMLTLQKWTILEAVEYIKTIFNKELLKGITNNDADYEKLAEFHDCLPVKLYNATKYIIQQNNLHKEIFTIDDYILKYSKKEIIAPVVNPPPYEGTNENNDDDDILNKIEKEAERFGDRVSKEAERFGHSVSNETDRIGHQISDEAARAEVRVKKFFKNEVCGFFKKI